MPLLYVYIFGDGIQNVGSGILKGVGRQNIGGVLNAVAFYVVGLPLSYVFCFLCGWDVFGLLLGIVCAVMCQVAVHVVLLYFFPSYLFHDDQWVRISQHSEHGEGKFNIICV